MPDAITQTAHAKINIGLTITGRRNNPGKRRGTFHLLHTLFQEVEFGDEVSLRSAPDGEIKLSITGPYAHQVPVDETNLCHKAASLLQRKRGRSDGVAISLVKNVPPGSGLGGGSSDGAAVLKAANELWGLSLSDDHLEEVGAELGADVPFFIHGGLQLGEGVGDQLTRLDGAAAIPVVLVISNLKIDTGWAYGLFAERQEFARSPGFDNLLAQEPTPWSSFVNDFEEVVFPQHPELRTIKETLLESGAHHAGLSGSGSTVYGLFNEEPDAESLRSLPLSARVVITHAVRNQ